MPTPQYDQGTLPPYHMIWRYTRCALPMYWGTRPSKPQIRRLWLQPINLTVFVLLHTRFIIVLDVVVVSVTEIA